MIKIEIINFDSSLFPEDFKTIKNPPKKIYAEGNLNLLNTNAISIIGSRACSINGMQIAKSFAKDLAKADLTIVSGMAAGIDTSAHIGALEVKGKTIAVLGCGFKNIFPKENIKLFNEIIEKDGLVISEYSPEEPANSKKFLARNRIVSALSIGILVVEAAYRSGTSVTCKFAIEQNKEVFCIPHDISDKHGTGTNKLIKNGAHLVTSAKDIIEYFDFLDYTEDSNNKLNSEKLEIAPQYLDIYNLLVGPPLNINQICNYLNKPASEVNNALFLLELDGAISKTPFGYQANCDR